MKKYIIAASFLPAIAFAQNYDVQSLSGMVDAVRGILNLIFPVLLAIAVFVIAWGIFKFILNAGDAEARATGRSFILWGVVGIFLMLSIWGLVNILVNTFTLDNVAPPVPELVPGSVTSSSGSSSSSSSSSSNFP